jgi:hypothetical protein
MNPATLRLKQNGSRMSRGFFVEILRVERRRERGWAQKGDVSGYLASLVSEAVWASGTSMVSANGFPVTSIAMESFRFVS